MIFSSLIMNSLSIFSSEFKILVEVNSGKFLKAFPLFKSVTFWLVYSSLKDCPLIFTLLFAISKSYE